MAKSWHHVCLWTYIHTYKQTQMRNASHWLEVYFVILYIVVYYKVKKILILPSESKQNFLKETSPLRLHVHVHWAKKNIDKCTDVIIANFCYNTFSSNDTIITESRQQFSSTKWWHWREVMIRWTALGSFPILLHLLLKTGGFMQHVHGVTLHVQLG